MLHTIPLQYPHLTKPGTKLVWKFASDSKWKLNHLWSLCGVGDREIVKIVGVAHLSPAILKWVQRISASVPFTKWKCVFKSIAADWFCSTLSIRYHRLTMVSKNIFPRKPKSAGVPGNDLVPQTARFRVIPTVYQLQGSGGTLFRRWQATRWEI